MVHCEICIVQDETMYTCLSSALWLKSGICSSSVTAGAYQCISGAYSFYAAYIATGGVFELPWSIGHHHPQGENLLLVDDENHATIVLMIVI